MPIFYHKHINETTRLAIWKIEEPESFFATAVPLNRQITHPHKRLQHLAGRYLLSYLFPNFPEHEIEIADARKPFLPNEQYHFSISHCDQYAAAIVSSNMRVGVDVELVTPKVEKIKNKFLHADELRFTNTIVQRHHLHLLSILWCAKETMFKWYGKGEVSFKEMLRTMPFAFDEKGTIEAAFIKPGLQQQLQIHYRQLSNIILTWTATTP